MDTAKLLRFAGLRQIGQFAIDFTVSIIIARLLTPREIGAYSIALAAVLVASLLRTAGVGAFLVQSRSLDRHMVGGALGLAMTTGFTLGLVVLAARGFIADFYHAPAIADLLVVVAASFALTPFQSVASGLLSRDLLVGRSALAELSGCVAGAATTLSCAYNGMGSISMAWGTLVNAAVCMLFYLFLAPPLFWSRPRFHGWREIWSVSGWVTGATLFNQVGARSNELVIGKTLSVTQSALLDRAEALPRMIWTYLMPPVLSVLAPIVAHEIRNGENLRSITISRMRFFGCVFVPVLFGLASQSNHMLITLYGTQWLASAVPAMWICISSAISGQFVVMNSTLIAMGKTRDVFVANVVEQGARFIMLIALGGTTISIVAFGYLFVGLTYAATICYFARLRGILPLADIPRAIAPSFITGPAMFGVGLACNRLFDDILHTSHAVALLGAVAAMAVTLTALLVIVEPNVLRFAQKLLFLRRQPPAPTV